MKLALAILAFVVLAIVVTARIPRSAVYLQDLPGVGWVIELIGVHEAAPLEVELAFDHPPSPQELARGRELLAARLRMPVEIRGDKLVVGGDDPFRVTQLHLHHPPLRVFSVVYESPELEALRRAMLRDEQATRLGLAVKLDTIGYHVEAPSETLYVNPAWADKHHCTGHHIEGTGTACYLSAKQRFDAYVRGDAELFIDAHPLALPPGRDLYATDSGPIYELDARPLEVPVANLQLTREAALIPLAAAPATDAELVVEVVPGSLVAGKPVGDKLAIPPDPDYELAALGLRVR